MAKAKKNFYDKECSKMTTPGFHAISFNALKHINKPSRQKPWNVMELFSDKLENEALEIMGEFYNKISHEFVPLEETDIPVPSNDSDIWFEITAGQVESAIQMIKKPRSTVPGDIPPPFSTTDSLQHFQASSRYL